MREYTDKKGYRYFVRGGICDTFKTFYAVPGKAKQRSCLTFKDWRVTPEEAQADLDRIAAERGWMEVVK